MEISGYEIGLDDVEITTKDIPGWTVANEGRVTVALDLTITDELKAEGIAREFINRIQNLRKDKGFEVTDRIEISLEENMPFRKELELNEGYISGEVLAEKMNFIPEILDGENLEIDDVKFTIKISKI